MKVNLKTRKLYTDNGEFIKELKCNHQVTKEDLKDSASNSKIKVCNFCNKSLYKTENLTDTELKELVKKEPNVCFYVRKGQANISKIESGKLLYFSDLYGACSIECLDCSFETKSFVTNLRTQSNKPCQCQQCGEIYENLHKKTCHHKNLSSLKPLFCGNCKSNNIQVVNHIIG